VVLCHGFTGSPNSLRPWAQHLAAEGFTVRVPLLPGHGTRWQDANATRWPDWYGELERTFDELAARCETVFCGGLSMGGALGLRLAECKGAALAGLVLVNPSVTTARFDARYLLPVLGRLLPGWLAISNDIKKPGVDEVSYRVNPLKAMLSVRELWGVVCADLHRVSQPLLLFRSRVDHVVDAINGRVVLAGVSSIDTTERVLDDSYHVATLDHDAPEIFATSVAWFRERCPGQETARNISDGATKE
jgi:carboxylesterase